ncbi:MULTISPECIES: hypothetical protein [unclassified Kitasatospora]|uniref:hypothetical protein n=1 Tax=unclassified Kitasatospora TaxID=2633591 RepID=UPI00340C1AC0
MADVDDEGDPDASLGEAPSAWTITVSRNIRSIASRPAHWCAAAGGDVMPGG